MPVLLSRSRGFTIVELVVVVAVIGVLVPLVIGPLGTFYQANTSSLGRTTKETDNRGVLRQIEKDLVNNKNFTDSYTVAAPLGAKSGSTWGANWSYTGMGANHSERRVLIAMVPATSALAGNDPSNTRYPIFKAATGSCPAEPTASMAVYTAVVYYMAPAPGSNAALGPGQTNPYNLYRRTIVPALQTGESYCYGRTPAQTTTCMTTCNSMDALLVSDIRSFVVDYYFNQDVATTITGQYTNAPANPITDAKAIKITTKTGQMIEGNATEIEASIRISRTY